MKNFNHVDINNKISNFRLWKNFNLFQFMLISLNRKNIYTDFLILLPFFLIFGGTVFQNTSFSNISSLTKTLSFFYMITYVIIHQKLSLNLLFFTALFFPFWVYALFNNPYNQQAAYADGIRYLFPIATLYYSFAIRKHLPLLMKFVVAFILLNFVVQLSNYFFWLMGAKDQWFYYTMRGGVRWANMTAGFLRATGTVVFFSLFGFVNLIAFFLIHKFYYGKYKTPLMLICVLGLFLSFSYKGIAAFAIVLIFYYYRQIFKVFLYVLIGILFIYITIPSKINRFIYDITLRVNLYITEGNSARGESYRVMFDEIKSGNWFGKGAGVFGGPASTQFNSPYYSEVNFNWYDTKWMGLTTTDTYPPHAFVELGIIGALLYFLLILSPLFKTRVNSYYKLALVVYFCLMTDMMVSFSLNNLEYLFFSLVFVYPILYYNKANHKPMLNG